MIFNIACKQCQEPITFNKDHISERSGKKIPLDVLTNTPHICKNRAKTYHDCRKGCGQQIYFDPEVRSDTGKYIPLDKQTEQPHNCNADITASGEGKPQLLKIALVMALHMMLSIFGLMMMLTNVD